MSVIVKGLTKTFGKQIAVNQLSFTVSKGEILGFLGPNGAGKTTTMKLLTTFLSPSEGDAEICGFSILKSPIEVKRCIGYLPEHNPLYKDMYVREYLLGFARLTKVNKPTKRVEDLIEMTGLTREQNKLIGSLSKGYRQRVGLSQALVHDPQVLILDEPTSGLDPNQLIEIRNLVRNIGKEKTLIFSTHIMQEVSALCDRVIIIDRGIKVADDSIESLQDQMDQKQVIWLEFTNAINAEVLKQIKGVLKVSSEGKSKYQIVARKDIEVRDLIFAESVKQGWSIREMVKDKSSIENIFAEMTNTDQK
ncbi:MAG: gliding motility-associated ABC transporter ATP-binding subunit GldA [Saprospiraceae bacterium]|nr:gliding motility-associated ABC transporter ATP-binding subunit GldA [Saprospiraceae bacterium]